MLVRPQLWGQPLAGRLLALGGCVAVLTALQRLLYPIAAILLSVSRTGLGFGLLACALGLSITRASLSHGLIERLREVVYSRLGSALRSLPVSLPSACPPLEQLGPQVARSLPWVELHFGQTLPILLGNALALPVLLAVAVREVGAGAWLALLALGLAAGLASLAWRAARQATRASWEEFRGIASSVERGLRARVELRAHGLGARFEQDLSNQVLRWALVDQRAHRFRALTSWSFPVFTLAVAMLLAWLLGYDLGAWLHGTVLRGGREAFAIGGLVLGSVPVLIGLSRGVANALHERTYVRAVAPLFEASAVELPRSVGEGDIGDITLEEARFEFPSASGGLPVVVRADLTLRRGESLALLGPNGCGKTSVALSVMGLLRPTSGRCVVQCEQEELETACLLGHVAYLPQSSYFGQHETVREAILFAAPEAQEDPMLAMLGRFWPREQQQGLLERRVSTLSSGQQRVVALTRVLLRGAALVVLDEPEANLDFAAASTVVELLSEVTAKQRMLILTHDARFAAAADRVLLFDEQRTLRDPELRRVRNNPRQEARDAS